MKNTEEHVSLDLSEYLVHFVAVRALGSVAEIKCESDLGFG